MINLLLRIIYFSKINTRRFHAMATCNKQHRYLKGFNELPEAQADDSHGQARGVLTTKFSL